MKESEYILMTNKTNVDTALRAMRDTLPGFDDVVTEKERNEIISQLAEWQEKFHKKVKINPEK